MDLDANDGLPSWPSVTMSSGSRKSTSCRVRCETRQVLPQHAIVGNGEEGSGDMGTGEGKCIALGRAREKIDAPRLSISRGAPFKLRSAAARRAQ